MELKGKALFNLLRISWIEDRNSKIEQWQIEDLRHLSIEDLFSRLKKLGLILNEESFYLYAENCESPEELADCVWFEEEDLEGHDKAYLLLFELWRKLLPEKLCLSVLCDEIDQLIGLYDQDLLEDEEALPKILSILEDVLDDSCDADGDPKAIFAEVASFCAHDLESFIVDYIADQIEEKEETYASELLDAFYDYSADPGRFDLLRAQWLALSDMEKSSMIYERILEDLVETPRLDLHLLMIENLIHHGDVRLFMQAVRQALPLLGTEEEFQNLLGMLAAYYRCLDKEEEEKRINELLRERTSRLPESPLQRKDEGLAQVSEWVSE